MLTDQNAAHTLPFFACALGLMPKVWTLHLSWDLTECSTAVLRESLKGMSFASVESVSVPANGGFFLHHCPFVISVNTSAPAHRHSSTNTVILADSMSSQKLTTLYIHVVRAGGRIFEGILSDIAMDDTTVKIMYITWKWRIKTLRTTGMQPFTVDLSTIPIRLHLVHRIQYVLIFYPYEQHVEKICLSIAYRDVKQSWPRSLTVKGTEMKNDSGLQRGPAPLKKRMTPSSLQYASRESKKKTKICDHILFYDSRKSQFQ
ncbi:hypothetical protein ARMGADRAFT_1033794 [Armillaria gallica]|uniref:Uncharacterized protein n=1 Tax=Armillaria gallica TaxID=47427 RepID=A0A2H3DIB3_ARMGA|nr:hypothetical protein ARMGADRAFT_1033794 [Armillaria gallica]